MVMFSRTKKCFRNQAYDILENVKKLCTVIAVLLSFGNATAAIRGKLKSQEHMCAKVSDSYQVGIKKFKKRPVA